MNLDLRKGLGETDQYKAWKFPGGELHFKLKISGNPVTFKIITNMTTSDDIILLLLVVDTLKKDYPTSIIGLHINYMGYQQADRNFGKNECFSLKTICNLINSMNLPYIEVFDPHSDVTPALLNNCEVRDNSEFIEDVLNRLSSEYSSDMDYDIMDDPKIKNLIILSPDSGAYKKIFSLCEKIGFKGQIECCSKSRNHETGEKTIIVPKFDETKDVLIIDDICLAGGTFLGVANQIKNKCYLAVSHGIFNNGVEHLLKRFETIYTTDSRCEIEHEKVKIYSL